MKKNKTSVFSVFMILSSTSVMAQDAASIDVGGFQIFPSLSYTGKFDDNVTRSDSDEIDSYVSVISPELVLLNTFNGNRYQIGAGVSRGIYSSSSADNYTDAFIDASIEYEMNSRARISASATLELGHDDRGTVFSIGTGNSIAEPDQFKQTELDFVYSYGALTSVARIDLIANMLTLDYDIDNVDAYLARDRKLTEFGGIFYYEVGAATDVTFDFSSTRIDYDFALDPTLPLDSNELSALVGLRWESTASTTGFAKIGAQEKKFDAAAREDFSGAQWELGVVWSPYERSDFTLTSQGNTRETNGEGNFIRRKEVGLEWNHEWVERLSSNASLVVGNDTYDGEADVREDDIIELRLSFDYQFKRWLSVELEYVLEDRSSNREIINYDRNVIGLTVTATL